MSESDPVGKITFPTRQANHLGEWVAVYLDPMPGSGERICIGVVASDASNVCTREPNALDRFQWVYGNSASSLCHAATLTMLEARSIAEEGGLESLASGLGGIEGLWVSQPRRGAGRDLEDLASLALRQTSALIGTVPVEDQSIFVPSERPSPIVRAVRAIVVNLRPALKSSFGRTFALSDYSRSTGYGFVGQRLVANFAALGGTGPEALSGQVDRAKARLWDLWQLKEGILGDVLGAPMRGCEFDLLACPAVSGGERGRRQVRSVSQSLLNEAAETLEKEADRFQIRWRYLPSPREIAQVVLAKEAA